LSAPDDPPERGAGSAAGAARAAGGADDAGGGAAWTGRGAPTAAGGVDDLGRLSGQKLRADVHDGRDLGSEQLLVLASVAREGALQGSHDAVDDVVSFFAR